MSIAQQYQRILNENKAKPPIEHPAVVEAANSGREDKENFNLIVLRPTSPVLMINKDVS